VESAEQLIRQAMIQSPLTLGSVIVRGQAPWRFLAIIHDLNQNPTWREEWINQALQEIFSQAEQRQVRSLAMPILGGVHGQLSKSRFLKLLYAGLPAKGFSHLKRLWIMTTINLQPDLVTLETSSNPDSGKWH
jgi:hypothetical protein